MNALLVALVFAVSGIPNADVSCAPTAAQWKAESHAARPDLPEVWGLSWASERRIRMAPWICANLKPGTFPGFLGEALNIVAHEATHLKRGDADEHEPRAAGCAWPSRLAQRFYGITFHTRASRLVAQGAAEGGCS